MENTYPPTILGHIDTFMALKHQWRSFSNESEKGICDYPRMNRNNLRFALFAIYPAATPYHILSGMDEWFQNIENPNNHLIHIKNIDDFDKVKNSDLIGAILHTEGAGGYDSELKTLRLAHRLGLRTTGITWANVNQFGTGFLFRSPQIDRGLTAEGKKFVQEAQKLGITIDVSHLNDRSFWDVMEIIEKPVMASHSNARSICNMGRNLTDEQIVAIHKHHGVIGLNWGTMFLDPKVSPDDFSHADPNIEFDVILKHLDHIVELTDINTIAIGTDYDGTNVPKCLDSADKMPKFYDYIVDHGYSRQDLEKIAFGNFYRVFNDTWK
ncbi:dipeptidase [Candidatus Harpocratesius sp.]